MNNISIAKETMAITKSKEYELDGQVISLPEIDYEEVSLISPEDGEKLLKADMDALYEQGKGTLEESKEHKMCKISITTEDSFQAGRRYDKVLVMNFANAHCPGGGFRFGDNAQEEALCRCSTLYASITSKKASKMYLYNNTHLGRVESDYMLISPNVCVFRDEKYHLLKEPVVLGVVTIAAPNRYGAALVASEKLVRETMMRRIRIMLRAAIKSGYRNLVLGAWGCGAFGNKPDQVSEYFKEILVTEGYGRYFDEICFAIYGTEDGKNFRTFKDCFGQELMEN